MSEAPDLFEAVLGWRCWIILGTELRSIAVGHSWKAEETAICKRPPSLYISADFANPPERHVPPADGCHCGLYAYHEPWMAERSRQSMEKQYGWQVVIGAVEMWGDVLVHGTGVRAEHARVLGLAVPPGSTLRPWRPPPAPLPGQFGFPARYRSGLLTGLTPVEAVAERYGVPAMPLGQLIEHVSEGRGKVPARLLPTAQPPLPTPPEMRLRDLALPTFSIIVCGITIGTDSALAVKLIWLVAVAFAVAALVNRLLAR